MKNTETLSVPEPIIVAAQIAVPVDTLKTEIQTLWAAREQNRLELAPRLYQLQIELSSPGKKDSGFKAWLKEAGIPRSTAYRLIKDHMKEMGLLPAKSEPATVSQVGQGAEIEPAEAERVEKPTESEPLPLIPGAVEQRIESFHKDLYGKSEKLQKDLDGYLWDMKLMISSAEGKEEEDIRIWHTVIDLMEKEQLVLNDRRRKLRKSLKNAKEQLQRVQEGWRPLECLVKQWESQPAIEAVN